MCHHTNRLGGNSSRRSKKSKQSRASARRADPDREARRRKKVASKALANAAKRAKLASSAAATRPGELCWCPTCEKVWRAHSGHEEPVVSATPRSDNDQPHWEGDEFVDGPITFSAGWAPEWAFTLPGAPRREQSVAVGSPSDIMSDRQEV
jgi:hypothetical protein